MSSQVTYKPTTDDVKRLREATGAGMLDCRNALVSAGGDYDAARKGLIDQGIAKATKKAERAASEGLVGSYIHVGGKIGVLVEVNCETDFVARNDRFQELVRDIAMHVAAMPVEYIERADVPEARVAEIRADLAKTMPEGKPPAVLEKIMDGRLNKWYEEHVLVDQPFVKSEDGQTVGELVGAVVGILGEKIKVRRFAKFALGEA